ncbi:hypothetical protein RM844_29885 [Streptomyces sp. DSM 44915]|uniref:Secreted protein n=1 Tax=Streptomyces chisholmiae TaxID=3075540 RepID=A0ABU2JZR7_9ACTN|nr:hypothetical protein [Streptomyces sp. DSM 44915]MDT0270490.1 hypothetical protein [Streptomyces sp. DSM 44915]
MVEQTPGSGGGAGQARLPAAFLAHAVATAPPGAPVVALALDQARALPPGPERGRLLTALLTGPCAAEAPGWLLAAALSTDELPPLRAALDHPGCPPEWPAEVVARSADERLGALGHAGASAALRAAVVAELRRRVPSPPPPVDTRSAAEPNAAWLALRSPDLADEVFAAAVRLLPGPPAQLAEGQPLGAWVAGHRAALTAWRALWREVLTTHPERTAELWALVTDEQARAVLGETLLGALPRQVPAGLLAELATADLASAAGAALTSRVCQALHAGRSPDETAASFADELAALPPADRRLPLAYLGAFGGTPDRGLAAATDWVARALAERWRPLLAAADDEPGWRTPPATRAALRRRFAEVALTALELWRPRPGFPLCQPEQLAWLTELTRLLPGQRHEFRGRAGAFLADAERGPAHRRRRRGAYPAADDPAYDRALHELRKGLGLGWRGIPGNPPLTELAYQPAAILDRFGAPGVADERLERLLLTHAVRGYPSGPSVAELLARHSAPGAALRRLTERSAELLADHPGAERVWVALVLASEHREPATLRALPAALALAAPPAPADGGPSVLSLVTEAFAELPAAWAHLATGQGRARGARRTLGEALDTALAAALATAATPRPPA